ncbi:hypothetical protein BC628DRAFT_264273 [Trametes gibbosa]|nr:hypothetical protein BC628DRAFT_264273 [Trametes gibbosa]
MKTPSTRTFQSRKAPSLARVPHPRRSLNHTISYPLFLRRASALRVPQLTPAKHSGSSVQLSFLSVLTISTRALAAPRHPTDHTTHTAQHVRPRTLPYQTKPSRIAHRAARGHVPSHSTRPAVASSGLARPLRARICRRLPA